MAPKTRTTNQGENQPMSAEAIAQMVAQQVAAAIAQHEANRSMDTGDGSNHINSNLIGGCTYKAFMDCKPKGFNGSEGAVGVIRWIEKMEAVLDISNCADNTKVKFAASMFSDEALTWWNLHVQTMTREVAHQLTWDELKTMLLEKYSPRNELQKLEQEFWHLTMVDAEVAAYTTRFHELSRLLPHMVTPEFKRIERYIWGLAPQIRGMVTSSKPPTIQSAVTLAHSLTDEAVRTGALGNKGNGGKQHDNKRKWAGKKTGYHSGKKQESARVFAAVATEKKPYSGPLPKCNKCNFHHHGTCESFTCTICKKPGHTAKRCRYAGNASTPSPNPRACFECGATNHFKKECPKLKDQNSNQARGRAFVIGAGEARQDPNIVTGMFLINDIYASVLFDTGADRSFVSTSFRPLINVKPDKLKHKYVIELANGKLIETSEIIRGCTLNLENHKFSIDLLPVTLGSFDLVIGMDWFSRNRAEVICGEKTVRIPLPNGEVLIVQGEKGETRMKIISCMKAHKYLRKKYQAILAHIIGQESKERRIEDIPVVRDYPEVFPEDLPGLPPPRQVEFRIDLTPGAAPVAKPPYRLAPSEMKELSNQLQELLDKGFIRPSSSPWGAPIIGN
ncbi:uncharacterized protein LOC118482595 [Helianthus annuus]|uniref:uncharacterized protein LOC118482595 n=1 Tax=Helianthus annuus TaxID=4232 RepID=UPI001652CA2E|nr:uncharacterized protein LOC118482595 [Helianthus annuus]